MSKEQNNQLMTVQTEEDKYFYDLSLALERLKNNPDFKLVFLDGYMKKFAIDKVSLLYTELSSQRVHVMEKLVAIANFESYIHLIENIGESYKQRLLEEKEAEDKAKKNEKEGVKDAGF